MREAKVKIYKFDELPSAAQEKAISDHINFEIETMDSHSPYYPEYEEMEKMQTPWFINEAIYENHKTAIIESLEANNYEFTVNGKFWNGAQEL